MERQPPDPDSTRGETPPAAPRRERNGLDFDRLKRPLLGVVGTALVVRGLQQRSLRGAATALVGGALLSTSLGENARIRTMVESRTGLGGGDEETAFSRSVVVGRPANELYELWRDPEQFSRVVGHFADVAETDGGRLEWTVHGPRGKDVSWETDVVGEEPGETLRWEAGEDATVPNEGSVRFTPAPGDRGTVVTLSIRFDPPGGSVGNAALERLDVAPEMLVGTALNRFKSLAETGEIPTTKDGNPSARGEGGLV